MDRPENPLEENRRLRRTMRDLVALSTLPAVWTGMATDGIARSLADVLLNTLSLDLVYVRLAGQTGEGVVEVVRTRHRPDAAHFEAVRAAVAPLFGSDRAEPPSTIPDPSGAGTLHVAVTRFGVGGDFGVLVTGSSNADFPTERDRLLLCVGANQTAIVVQRSRAEQRAIEQGERLRTTLASIGDGVITTDTEGRVTNLNAVAESLTGWTTADAVGRPLDAVFNIVNEQTLSPVENPATRALREGVIVGLANHTILICKDGTERPIDDSAAPIRCKEGEVVGCVLVFRDVAERRREEVAQAERTRLVALRADVSTAIAAAQPIRTTLQCCTEALVRHLDVAFARIWTLNGAGDVLELQASAGQYTHLDGPHSRVAVGEFKIGRIAKTRRPHLTNDVPHDPNVSDQEWARREGMVAFAGYPLVVEGRCVGVLAVFARRWLTEAVVADLAPLADQIAQHIDRRRGEEELRETRSRLEFTLAAAEIGTWEFDPARNVVRADPNLARMFGVDPGEAAGGPIEIYMKAIHPNDRDRVAGAIGRALEAGEGYEADYRLVGPGEAVRWVVARGRVERDAVGRAVRLPGVVIDITAQRQAEAALRESERRLRFVMDSMPQKIFTATPSGDVDYFNPIWMEFTGLSFEQIRDWGWTQFIHPDDVAENVRVWKHSVETREPFQFEHRFRRADGEYRWHISRAKAMRDAEGRVVMWIGSNTDFHDAKQAEQAAVRRSEQVRRLAEVATRLATAYDVASVVAVVNEEARHLVVSHQSVTSFTTDQNWGQAITGVSLSDKYARWKDYDTQPDGSGVYSLVCRTNKPVRMTQAELEAHPAYKRFGKHAPDHPPMRGWLAAPLVGRDGRNIGLVQLSDKCEGEFTGDDEAVLVQLAQTASVAIENARLYEQLRDADRRKDEFLATLAHELRNPLAPVRNALQVMKLSDKREARDQARGVMERQLEQMVRLVDDLMDVSRISRGKLELKTERVPVAAVLTSAVETSRPLIEQMGHDLTVALPDHPVVIDADLTRLAQVFMNLLNNSAKYMDRGGHIWLTAERQGGDVVVAVKDAGIGIAADQLPRVFELFSQVDRSLEKSQGGLGIGLSLVKRLVEMHGGTIEARSEGLGRGAEFVVRLPVVVEASVPPRAERREEQVVPRSSLRILIVDDNRDGADSLSDMLGILGNDTRTAYDGEEAVAAAAAFRPDVILLDLGLPRLNGYDACRRIREQQGGVPPVIIAQTGWGQDEDRHRTTAAGFDHHLVKPVDPTALMKLLAGLQPSATNPHAS